MKKQPQPKLRTMVKFNTGTRRHKSKKDYNRKAPWYAEHSAKGGLE
jgi:hypothetical protein